MPATRADSGATKPIPRGRARGLRAVWQVIKETVGACMRYRVIGLAAECAFFAILSLPPLVFGLAGTLGYAAKIFGPSTVGNVKQGIIEGARQALTEESVQAVLVPTLDSVLARGRADIISIGFVIALWSGSRALNVIILAVTIMYGLEGKRGLIKTRALAFVMYLGALVIGVIVLPLMMVGPSLVRSLLPDRVSVLAGLYWPLVVLLSTVFLATLYHLAVPVRKSWRQALAGSTLVLVIWIGGSYLLRWVLGNSVGSTSIYGPLAAPIVVLLWLFLVAIAVLIGAAFNAAFDGEVARRREERRQVHEEAHVQVAEEPEPTATATSTTTDEDEDEEPTRELVRPETARTAVWADRGHAEPDEPRSR